MVTSNVPRSLDKIKEDIKSLEEINERQEARINNIEGKSLQDMSRYFLFQGVILASVMVTTFDCGYWWVALALNIVVGLLNLLNLATNTHKYSKCRVELDQNMRDLEDLKYELRNGFKTSHPSEPDHLAEWRRLAFIWFNFVLCLVAAAFVCACCYLNRCHQDKAHSRSNDTTKYQQCFCCLNTTAILT